MERSGAEELMKMDINVGLIYRFEAPTDVLLQIEAAALPCQSIMATDLTTSPIDHFARVAAEEDIGERIWMRAEGDLQISYRSQVQIKRPPSDLEILAMTPPHLLPAETVRFLMPSRYCQSDLFGQLVDKEFGALSGGARISAIRNWIAATFSYLPGSSNSQTTAIDSFVQRQGVCRDYSHVLIALARASDIPARYVSVYAPGVTPQDFHAVAEVYLDGGWHLVDATGMASAEQMVVKGVGPDASNVPFLSAFGNTRMVEQSVTIRILED